MASRIAEAYVQIVPRVDGVAKNLRGQLSGEMGAAGTEGGKGFAAGFKSIVGPALIAGAAVAAAAVGKLIKDSISAASDFAEAGTAVGEVFGDASKTINTFAEDAAKSLGQSKTQVLDAAKQFGIYGKAAGLAGDENAKFSTDLVTLATDLASFNNTSVDEAIQALGAGLRGESEPLRRYGVLLNDAELKARAMEMGIYDGNGALTMQQKVLAANAAIFAQTSTQQGDFARTSGGLANQQRILAAQFENISITLGSFFLPIVERVANFLTGNVMPAISNFLIAVRDNGLGPALGQLFAQISTMRQSFLEAMVEALPGIIDAIVAFIPTLVEGATNLVTMMIGALVASLPAIIEGAIKLFNGIIDGLVQVIPVIVDAIVKMIPVLITAIVNALPLIINGAITLFLGIIQGILRALPQIISALVKALPKIIKAVADALPLIIDGAIKLFLGIIDGLIKALPQIIKAVIEAMPKIIKALIDAIPLFIDAGIQLIKGLIKGIGQAIPNLISAIGDGIGKAIDAGKKLLGIKSPSTVFAEIGTNVVQGMAQGISRNSALPIKALNKVNNGLINAGNGSMLTGSPSFVRPSGTLDGLAGGMGAAKTIIYNAAPNQSLDAEQALFTAMKRGKVIAGW
jgi:hypothetical protein